MQTKLLAILLILACTACLYLPSQAGEPPCQDTVKAEVEGNAIHVFHDQAEWNCCATIVFELFQAEDTLNLFEFETFEVGPCDCICCFDLKTEITDVPPGAYLVRVLNGHAEEVFGEVWVVMGMGMSLGSSLGLTEQSPCGGWNTGVREESDSTWGRIKALYR